MDAFSLPSLFARAAVTSLCVAVAGSAIAQESVAPALQIDGVFADWHTPDAAVVDPTGDAGGRFDLTLVQAKLDGGKAYIDVTITQPLNLQSGQRTDGPFGLVLELDDNRHMHADFRQRAFTLNDEPATWHAFHYVAAPTYASTRFEMRFDLAPLNAKPGDVLRVMFTGADLLDEPLEVEVTQAALQLPAEAEPLSLDRPGDATLRIASLNTLRGGLSDPERSRQLARLVKAASPDVLALQESDNTSDDQLRKALAPALNRTGVKRPETNVVRDSGGVALVSRYPLEPVEIDGRAVGARVTLPNGERTLIVSVHLKCCGHADSREDDRRVEQASLLVRSLITAQLAEQDSEAQMMSASSGAQGVVTGVPAVVIGDYNLVGSRQPLDVFEQAGLARLKPYHVDGHDAYTWYQPSSSYTPGQLDLITYTSALLDAKHSYLLDTKRLSAKALRAHGLRVDDSRATDHLLMVADFAHVGDERVASESASDPASLTTSVEVEE